KFYYFLQLYYMSDLPIPTQPNQPKKSPMTDIFSSLISGGCHVVAQVGFRKFRKSDVGMDYRKLRDLLKAGKWKEADEETLRVMLCVGGTREGWLNVESFDNFPCADLRTIDQLWVKYSDGRFGFSVQKRIYQGLGGTREYNQEIWWEMFTDKVGWTKGGKWLYYSDITFDKKAPEGHLPCLVFGCWLWGGLRVLFSRVETCKL
ncbi:MAG: GUN4 domain-containing protein, partial [Dolichospermum sp.]